MKRGLVAAIVAGVVLAGSVPLLAHHSFAATYFEDKAQTIEGDLVQFVLSIIRILTCTSRRPTRTAEAALGSSSGDRGCS